MANAKSSDPPKNCFVIMPISDMEGYEKGHFGRVYDHLIRPACEASGFVPIRADDATKTNYIVIDVLRSILDAPVAICDLSGRNPNVMYELGIRQAFNKPVVLMKDQRTEKIFDIQGLRYTEYDESLRVDTVLRDSDRLAAFLRNTATSEDVNSVVQLLGVRPAEMTQSIQLSKETSVLLSAVEDIGRRVRTIEKDISGFPAFTPVNTLELVDGTTARLGETIYDSSGAEVGKLLGFTTETIILQSKDGGLTRIKRNSAEYPGLTMIPF